MSGEEAKAPRRKIPSWLPQVLGYCLSAGCLLWVLHGYPTGELIPAIRDLDWKWVAVGIAADLSVYVTHGWRWNTLLLPVARLKLWRTVQAIYIGLFANEVLPLARGRVDPLLPAGPLERAAALGGIRIGGGGTADRRFLDAHRLRDHRQPGEGDPRGPGHPGADCGRAAGAGRDRPGVGRSSQAGSPRGHQREPVGVNAAPRDRRSPPDGQRAHLELHRADQPALPGTAYLFPVMPS